MSGSPFTHWVLRVPNFDENNQCRTFLAAAINFEELRNCIN
jgi:hypothetical protein